MAKKVDWDRQKDSVAEGNYRHKLEDQIAELRKAGEENIRLKNIEKFSSIGRMARSIAHEIRNPLTNISLALEQLNSELPQNDDVNLLVEMISRNTSRINHLISDLIDSTKFAQLSFSHESINTILTEVVNTTQRFANQKNAHIRNAFANDLAALTVDREKIKTAFETLVVYAIESAPPNEGVVFISTATENNKCVITIQSNGNAISEEKAERLFEPNFNSKQGAATSLTHTQNTILNHCGSIYVESEQGKGITFTVILEFA